MVDLVCPVLQMISQCQSVKTVIETTTTTTVVETFKTSTSAGSEHGTVEL